jgi:putative ABC transport system permease protein
LLGVTIGIFAIIAVFTVVDSLEKNVKENLSFLGDKTIYIQKWPFIFNPNVPWWKYYNRPVPTVAEYKMLERLVDAHQGVSLVDQKGNATFKSGNNSIQGVSVIGATYYYSVAVNIPIDYGRYFSVQEAESSKNVAIVGYTIADALFPGQNAIGKTFKIKGIPFVVIGVLQKQGASVLGGPDTDNTSFIPYGTFSKMFANKWSSPSIVIKGVEGDEGLKQLESEVTGVLRSRRGLKPTQEDNFSINRPEQIVEAVNGIFGVLTLAGWVIGSFSILVGGFGIANIMFVSVKERTNIIGIQKSLGAKNYFILLQFLFEAVFLSILGGGAGVLIVYLLTFVPIGSLEIVLTPKNIALGLSVASIVGVLSGIIPAAVAARLDPVTAIRSK